MTAIAFCYTKSGFVVAADGRSRTYDATKDEYYPDREDCQKIFSIIESGKVLAYALIGDAVSSEDGFFHLRSEIEWQVERLSTRRSSNLHGYISAIGYKVNRAYEKALANGRLDFKYRDGGQYENLLARVIFAGYLRFPEFACLEVFRTETGTELTVSREQPNLGIPGLVAPKGILQIIDNDPRFAEYRLPFGPDISIEDACTLVKRKIEACASPLAAEMEPLCAGIGGHIHTAAVTPSGFRWLVPPVSFNRTKTRASLALKKGSTQN